jgi:hypothetical protein
MARRGERGGWILGWSGAFVWVLILAIVSLLKGDLLSAVFGGGLAAIAVAAILILAPWRHPTKPYWRLMLPLYVLFFLAVVWLVWDAGGPGALGLSAWSLFLLLPLFLPLYLAGRRRWIDTEHGEG